MAGMLHNVQGQPSVWFERMTRHRYARALVRREYRDLRRAGVSQAHARRAVSSLLTAASYEVTL